MADFTPDPELVQLFQSIEKTFQSTNLSPENWYILLTACLAASPDPESISHLYAHLRDRPQFSTSASRQQLVRELRETLVKCYPLVGVCKPLEAVLAISRIEKPEDKDYSFTRENWQNDEQNRKRAMEWFGKVYTHDGSDTLELFKSHKDFSELSVVITYGLFLSDRQVLGDEATELIVLAAIMSQNLPTETRWHIRGLRRIGVSKDDAKVVWKCINTVASHFGLRLNRVPTIEQVEAEV